jgi:hypothetical protein
MALPPLDSVRPRLARLLAPSGAALGLAAGLSLAALAAATPSRSEEAATPARPSEIEVTHFPPLLTVPGERLELRFDAYCLPANADDAERPCRARGSVFVRSGDRGPFTELPLRPDPRTSGRLHATVPEALARPPGGVSYYASIEDAETGASATVPAGGEEAPYRSLRLERPVLAELGPHRFGATRRASARVVEVAWGPGPLEVGLEQGRNLSPIGASSFDVRPDGTVFVLDEAKRRVLRFPPNGGQPTPIPLAIAGTIADLAVGEDRLYVLETVGPRAQAGSVRSFALSGNPLDREQLDEPAYRIETGPDGAPVVLRQRSGQWSVAATPAGALLPATALRASGRPGRPLPSGDEVTVLRLGLEIRVAVTGRKGARSEWQLTSDTPLAEVQLAEPLGRRLVVVARVYTDAKDEFLVLVLGPRGVERRFALPSWDWAETAPLSRFRLRGSSLYQLGSTPTTLFVDRYDLEVE